MFGFDSPAERVWFVVVAAPLVLGAVPLTLELGSMVGELPLGRTAFNLLMFVIYLAAVGFSGVLGTIVAPRIHRQVDATTRFGRTDVDPVVAQATIIVFAVYVVGMVAVGTTIFLPGIEDVGQVLGPLFVPFAPVFLISVLPFSDFQPLVGTTAFLILTTITGVWQVFLGVIVGTVFKRITTSA